MIPGAESIRRCLRRLRNRLAPGAVVLLYHRVVEENSDPWSLAVTPAHFAEHVEVIRRSGIPVTLGQIDHAVRERRRLPSAIAVTFDDGYADNLYKAKPVLERYDVPATVFAVSGSIGRDREFWWDELERTIFQPEVLSPSLDLPIGGRRFVWPGRDYRLNPRYGDERHALYRALWEALRWLDEDERDRGLRGVRAWSGATDKTRPSHRPLSAKELISLSENGLVEIGSHTATHPFLSTLPLAAQREEIARSKSRLEEMLDSRVSSFAYPHGDYARATVDIVREAGYRSAYAVNGCSVGSTADPFQIPRIAVGNCDGEEFSRRLFMWLRSSSGPPL